MRFDVINPWNWHQGSFEGIYIEPETGMMRACGDPPLQQSRMPLLAIQIQNFRLA